MLQHFQIQNKRNIRMNSSTGFKKRNLLRPPSGIREKEREFLKTIDISQSQTMILNQLKTQIARIQQEINATDQDRKLRTGEGSSSLQKSYVVILRKWLRENSFSTSQKQDDDFKVLKSLNVESYENGFRKLWRLLVGLDQIIYKSTQLQIVQFLKYDDTFNQLAQDSQKSSSILSTMGKTGFNPSTFQLTQILLQRNKDLFSLLLEGKHQLLGKEKRGPLKESKLEGNMKKQETNELIEQLRRQNEKLNGLLESLEKQKEANRKLTKQLEIKEQQIKSQSSQGALSARSTLTSTTPSEAFTQLEDRYTQRMNSLSQQISKLQSQLTDQKITISTLEKRAKMAEQQLKQTDKSKSIKPKQGSYQQALMEEMDKMKSGFERKIQKLLEDHAQKEKQMRTKEFQYRAENDKIKWEKGLLLKKFETIEGVQKSKK